MPQQALSLKARALRALAAREHTQAELSRKLAPHVQDGEDLGAVLAELQAKGFLSDTRAAQSIVHRRAPKLGAVRVLQELRQKGVNGQELSQMAAQLKLSELERARAVWTKRFREPASGDAGERAKQMRFLASRGFAPEVIRQVIRGHGDEN